MNKTKAVMQHLQDFGTINTWEAIKEYGASRLSSIIYNLRHKYKMDIVSEDIRFTDRYGHSSKYAKYVLVRGENNG